MGRKKSGNVSAKSASDTVGPSRPRSPGSVAATEQSGGRVAKKLFGDGNQSGDSNHGHGADRARLPNAGRRVEGTPARPRLRSAGGSGWQGCAIAVRGAGGKPRAFGDDVRRGSSSGVLMGSSQTKGGGKMR